MGLDGGHRCFAFLYSNVFGRLSEKDFGPYRTRLLARAGSTTLEIGAGNGLNLTHYALDRIEHLTLSEPDPHMYKRLRKDRLVVDRPSVRSIQAPADDLPVADGSVDSVVSTLVLCSVHDPAASLREIRRILQPDGRFLFIEHVRSPDESFAAKQDRGDRWWGKIAGGCHPNRETGAAIRSAGFDIDDGMETFDLKGAWLTRPFIMGVAMPAA